MAVGYHPTCIQISIVCLCNVKLTFTVTGKTVFLRSFFYNETEKAHDGESEYVYSRSNKYLTSYPLVAIDPQGQRAIFTFGKYFAYGLTSSNTEQTFICGPILTKIAAQGGQNKEDPIFIPYFDDSGRAGKLFYYSKTHMYTFLLVYASL